MKNLALSIAVILSGTAFAQDRHVVHCGVGLPGMHPPSPCEGKDEATSLGVRCSGSGLIGCIDDGHLGDSGENVGADCLEIYCISNLTRLCLSGEKCPWRDDGNMHSKGYRRGLQSKDVHVNFQQMTCSPFGLPLNAKSPSPMRMGWWEDRTEPGPFTEALCDAQGRLTLKGTHEESAPPPNVPKMGPICGQKVGLCHSTKDGGTYCAPTEIRTYNGYDEMMMNNATFLYSGACH